LEYAIVMTVQVHGKHALRYKIKAPD